MRFLTSALLAPAALLVASAPAALLAQEVVQALPGTTSADRLAEQMRALASNPRDLNALIAAADLSLSLGDLSGAASLFARAEKVSATDPRIKAGEGSILVRSERPGEALRYFSQAEAAGYDARNFAADRGLAYDLIGQQERAQRDYRLALKARPDDEIVKRYALSLGISGRRDTALEQLDPLLRKSDRSAWRIRAFVLAMGGDQAGAEKIATTMLPPGMAQGLQPFFQRLPSLLAADRAFAVHFGEVHATPERVADARLAPMLPQLAPEVQPVALAAVQPAASDRKDRNWRGRDRRGREGGRDAGVALASNTIVQPAATLRPGRQSVPAAAVRPTYQDATAALARVQPLPTETRSAPLTATPVPIASQARRRPRRCCRRRHSRRLPPGPVRLRVRPIWRRQRRRHRQHRLCRHLRRRLHRRRWRRRRGLLRPRQLPRRGRSHRASRRRRPNPQSKRRRPSWRHPGRQPGWPRRRRRMWLRIWRRSPPDPRPPSSKSRRQHRHRHRHRRSPRRRRGPRPIRFWRGSSRVFRSRRRSSASPSPPGPRQRQLPQYRRPKRLRA